MKNIVITGGTSGLGKALAEKYKAEGDNVIILARSASGENGIKCDVGKREEVERAFEEIAKRFAHIDILINNAGYGIFGAVEFTKPEDARAIFDVVFFGVFNCIQCALPLMNNGGKIINISSASAYFVLPFRSFYSASKAAVNMLSNGLKMELKDTDLQVTAICPGNIHTNFSKNRLQNLETNEHYGITILKASWRVADEEHKRMPLEYAVKKIAKIIGKRKLKAEYIIGFKYKLLHFAARFVPKSWIMAVSAKMARNNKH